MAQLMAGALQRSHGLAQRLVPDSLFGRLALLLLVAVVSSQVLALTLMFELMPFAPPHHPPPPSGFTHTVTAPPGHGPPPWFQVGLLMDISVRLLALVLAAWVGARWLSEPVRKLGLAAQELGRDLHRPAMPEEGTRECREAIRVFNRMQERMQLQLAQRDQFVAAVSHDLRTPLTRLTLRVQSLRDPQVRQSFSKDIRAMEDMIRTTLDYLRGMADPEPLVRLDVGSLLISLAQDCQDSGQDVQVQGGVHAAPLPAQACALRRCLGNLVENAVRYGQRARLSLIDLPGHVQICVHDDGPGIAPEELDKVLTPFYRVESSRNRNSGGVGLGLATAQQIAQTHGGSLTLSNPAEGGLLATLRLPNAKDGPNARLQKNRSTA